jgi:glycosyltransferase involved in cell wall biosynthesis
MSKSSGRLSLVKAATRAPQSSHRMRVLMTADAVGGVWNLSLDLAAGLRAHRIDVVLAVLGPSPSLAQRRAAARRGIHLEQAPYSLEWMAEPWKDVEAAAKWLELLERGLGCDLVHLNGYSYARFPFRGPKLVVGHSCVLSWWRAVRGDHAPAEWEPYRRAVAAGLAAAQHVVAPSAWMAAELRRTYHAPTEVTVIHNGRSSRRFAPSMKRAFVLASGRLWDEAKNLRALSRISGAVPWPVIIAGPLSMGAEEGAAREQAAADYGGVQLLGALNQAELARLYGAAPIYAHPARYEPFGLSVLEAALSGCALVLGDIPSLRELWNGAAVFVDPSDDGALARAITNLVNRPHERQFLALEARRRARSYSRDRMIRAYARLYGRMLAWPAVPSWPREAACAS